MKKQIAKYLIPTMIAVCFAGCFPAAEPLEPKIEPEPEPVQEVSALKGITICIDPGHGKTARKEKELVHPGKSEKKAANVSGASGAFMTEEELNLEMGIMLKEALETEGATVYITREEHESDMSNIERAEFANASGCDMVVRLHADGSENKSVSGVSVLVPSAKSVYDGYLSEKIVADSRRCAEYVLAEVCQNTGAKNRGISERADMTGFNWSCVPAVLLEMGFITNPAEEEKLADDAYRKQITDGIVTALERYFSE